MIVYQEAYICVYYTNIGLKICYSYILNGMDCDQDVCKQFMLLQFITKLQIKTYSKDKITSDDVY